MKSLTSPSSSTLLRACALVGASALLSIACSSAPSSETPEIRVTDPNLSPEYIPPTYTTYIDLRLDEKTFSLAYGNSAPGSSNLTIVDAHADPITRTAFSKAAPLMLPCDVTGIFGGLQIYYQDAWLVSPPGMFTKSQPMKLPLQPHVWPRMNEELWPDGNPQAKIHSLGWNDIAANFGGFSSVYGNLYEQTDNHAVPQQAGFFTVDSNEPNYNFWWLFTPSDLPVGAPFVLHFWITEYTCSTFDPACLYSDKNPKDNAIDVWLEKPSCGP